MVCALDSNRGVAKTPSARACRLVLSAVLGLASSTSARAERVAPRALTVGGRASNFATINVREGRTRTLVVQSGGSLDVRVTNPEARCAGFASAQPDLIVVVGSRRARELSVRVTRGHANVLINDSNGGWKCGADGMSVREPRPGHYDVWFLNPTSGTGSSPIQVRVSSR